MAEGEEVAKVQSELQRKAVSAGRELQDLEQKVFQNNPLFKFEWKTKSWLVSFQVVFVERRHHAWSLHGNLRITL